MRLARLVPLLLAAVPLCAQTSVPVLLRPLPAQTLATTTPPITIALTDYFAVPGVTGARFAHFDTVLGVFGVELRTDAAPRHVANFFNYVASGVYTSSFFHRAASFEAGGVSIIQGGGYTYTLPFQVLPITKLAPVALEYSLVNARGTLAAARTNDINSATSEWFFNTRDNTAILGPANNSGYSVFGRVLGTGMTIVDRIAALPRVNAGGAFGEIPVRNFSGGSIDQNHIVIVNSIREVGLFPALTGRSHVTFAVQNSAPQAVVASLSGSNLTIGGIAAGGATITIRATDVNGNTVEGGFVVTVSSAGGGPQITTPPAPQIVAAGSTAVFGVTATGADTYQWARNGAPLIGATNATLIIPGAVPASAGNYTVTVSGGGGSAVSEAAALTVVPATPNAGRLVNLAIRTAAGTGAQTLIVGFAVGGAGTAGAKPLLLRGVGPSLAQFGLAGALADPVMTVFQGDTTVATNDDWAGDAQVLARATQVGAFALTGPASRDAALAHSPAPGSYTVQIVGQAGATGLVLAEIYDATAAPGTAVPRLVNVSARTQVGTGGDILIAGFVIGGTTARTVLIRALGPALAGFGVPGVLADPRLQLFEDTRVIRENDNWGGDLQLTTVGAGVGAFALTDGSSRDAMLLVTLAPGSYTAQVSGVNNGTGVALVEVYEVP